MSTDSTARPRTRKPKNTNKDFPLHVHKGTGYWCKKVHGKVWYFGKVVDDPNGVGALEQWVREKADILAGRDPRNKVEGLTVDDLACRFLMHKEHLHDNGELAVRTYRGYFDTCENIVNAFGKLTVVANLRPEDFGKLRAKLAEKRGAVALRNEMQRVRSVFKFAFDEQLFEVPVRFGQSFTKPKLETVRREREEQRSEHGDRMFEAADIRLALDLLAGNEITIRLDDKTRGLLLCGQPCAWG